MISKKTIETLEKCDINLLEEHGIDYSNMDEDTISEVIEALKELEVYSDL